MHKSTVLALAGLLALAMPAAADEVRDAIEQADAQFVEAYKDGDAAAIATLYTETAKVLPPDATEVTGREAIQSLWQSYLDAGLKDLTLATTKVESDGNLAYEIGDFTIQVPAEDKSMVTATGNYLQLWKHDTDGNWRLHVDTWNDTPTE
jgi:uncharacterized protein (TIGR02246 family)